MVQRMLCLIIIFAVITTLLIGRLFSIQVMQVYEWLEPRNLVQRSVEQRLSQLNLDLGRGLIVDRNHEPLAGHSQDVLAFFPEVYRAKQESLIPSHKRRLAELLQISDKQWEQWVLQQTAPTFWSQAADSGLPSALDPQQREGISQLAIPGVYPVPFVYRYENAQPAAHLLGFTAYLSRSNESSSHPENESQKGAAGLERTLEPYLRKRKGTSIQYALDGVGRPILGLDARMHTQQTGYYPLQAVTTLDKSTQIKIESLMDEMSIRKGAVVVLDIGNSDVLAMASRPAFNPNDVHPEEADWSNLALQSFSPGSIFKTVTAAAALEAGIQPQQLFECRGELGRYGFSCWKREGHGVITFEQAYVRSCNIAFAHLAESLSAAQFEQTAKKLGLLTQIGWTTPKSDLLEQGKQFDHEQAGQLFADPSIKEDTGVRIQTSIGQRDVRMTPLQAANMVTAIVNQGEVHRPRVVKEIRHANGTLLQRFPSQSMIKKGEAQALSATTTQLLNLWMQEVVLEGTGKTLQQAEWKLAGKSGTALEEGDLNQENQWFIGYGPVEDPAYAVAVLVQTPLSSKPKAIPLFKEVMNILKNDDEKVKVH